jgi:BirA family biotin operon repressor/biotin-[acetyl-CoA-carboxylase] ligase
MDYTDFTFFLYFCIMEWKIEHIAETDSTNNWLREHGGEGNVVVWADYQTAGRGCATNRWESERGQNLTFSMLFHPVQVPVARQFRISMAVSLAICEALGQHIGDLSIKWPNDIYWRDGKICGILIENRIQGSVIRDCIVGIGLNVNQRRFLSDAPNPVSMWQICEHETDREQLLNAILQAFDRQLGQDVRQPYLSMLYRRKGFHPYADKGGAFMAEMVDVEDDGHLLLRDDDGRQRRYAFKEVSFI